MTGKVAVKRAALLGAGAGASAGTLANGTEEAVADDGVGAAASETLTLSTLMSTFCPAWQWPGMPQMKKW